MMFYFYFNFSHTTVYRHPDEIRKKYIHSAAILLAAAAFDASLTAIAPTDTTDIPPALLPVAPGCLCTPPAPSPRALREDVVKAPPAAAAAARGACVVGCSFSLPMAHTGSSRVVEETDDVAGAAAGGLPPPCPAAAAAAFSMPVPVVAEGFRAPWWPGAEGTAVVVDAAEEAAVPPRFMAIAPAEGFTYRLALPLVLPALPALMERGAAEEGAPTPPPPDTEDDEEEEEAPTALPDEEEADGAADDPASEPPA